MWPLLAGDTFLRCDPSPTGNRHQGPSIVLREDIPLLSGWLLCVRATSGTADVVLCEGEPRYVSSADFSLYKHTFHVKAPCLTNKPEYRTAGWIWCVCLNRKNAHEAEMRFRSHRGRRPWSAFFVTDCLVCLSAAKLISMDPGKICCSQACSARTTGLVELCVLCGSVGGEVASSAGCRSKRIQLIPAA